MEPPGAKEVCLNTTNCWEAKSREGLNGFSALVMAFLKVSGWPLVCSQPPGLDETLVLSHRSLPMIVSLGLFLPQVINSLEV